MDLNNQNLRRYKPWGRNKDTTETDDDGLASPTPRFSICISTNVEPEMLVNTVRQWFQEHGGVQLEVDKKVIFQSKQFAVVFRMSAKNSPATIVAEMRLLLEEARRLVYTQDGNYEFAVEEVPRFGVRPSIPKIQGQDTSKYQGNDRNENAHRRAMHYECSAEDVRQLQSLVQMAKEFLLVKVLWGPGAHLSNLAMDREERSLFYLSSMSELAESQIAQSKLWQPAGIVGIKDLNVEFDVIAQGKSTVTKVGARSIILGWPNYGDGIPLFREAHQQNPGADVDVVIPNCEAAVGMLAQINKNPAVFFVEGVFPKMGVPQEWGMAFAQKLFSSALVLSMHQYTWDEGTRTMTSPNDEQEKMDSAIRGQSWAKAALALPVSGDNQDQEYLPVDSLLRVIDDMSTTTLNTKNRCSKKSRAVPGGASYKGDAGAPTLVLGKVASTRNKADPSGEEVDDDDDSDDDNSEVSDMTTMTNKSIQRTELVELRRIRDLIQGGQLVDVTTVGLANLDIDTRGEEYTTDDVTNVHEEDEEEESVADSTEEMEYETKT